MNGDTPVTYVTGTKRFLECPGEPPTEHRGSECELVQTETTISCDGLGPSVEFRGYRTCQRAIEWEAPILVPMRNTVDFRAM
jgi:hypothetical protein